MKLLQLLENAQPHFPTSKEEVEVVLNRCYITNYIINDDLTVDVDGDVEFVLAHLKRIPIKFGKVSGEFDCSNHDLLTLEGAPRQVGGDFNCSYNDLATLKGAPREVGGNFNCSNNKLTSLRGSPREVGGHFDCTDNKLTSLKGSPREVGGRFDAIDNPLKSLDGIGHVHGRIFADF